MSEDELVRTWRRQHWKFFALFAGLALCSLLGSWFIEHSFHKLNLFDVLTAFCWGWWLSNFESYDKYKRRMMQAPKVDSAKE